MSDRDRLITAFYSGKLVHPSPDRLNIFDLANAIASIAGVRPELTDRVLDGWDPDRVRQRMRTLKSEQQILESWAANTNPPDSLRWDLKPEMDYLEQAQ